MFAIPCKVLKSMPYYFLFPLLLIQACEKSLSPVLSGQVRLSAEEVGVTEVWLGVKTEQVSGEFTLKLWRDDTCIFQGFLSGADTTVYDSALLPAHNYRYRARLERSRHPVLESAPLEITTMDTTSHDFQWEVYTFGTGGSSVLYDVAIIDENNIWAVGEIHASGGPYNAVHWDGQQWELKRIFYKGGFWSIRTIYAFDSNDIWFDAFVRWNGTSLIEMPIPEIFIGHGINKLWGTSSNDLYVVGNSGLIAHYDGSRWQKIESGTELPINDIWGAQDEDTGEYEILCVASRLDQNEGSELLKINNQSVEKLQTKGLSWSLKANWFIPDVIYYIGGDGLYFSRNLAGTWKRDLSLPFLYKHAVRGQAVNDVIVAGSFGLLSHFNGVSWHHYNGGHYPSINAAYRGIAIKGDIITAVGFYNIREALIVIGRRE